MENLPNRIHALLFLITICAGSAFTQNWESVSAGMSSPAILGMAVDANQRVYAVASNGEVYRSLDSGVTWQNISGSNHVNKTWEAARAIAVSPTTGSIFFGNVDGQTFRSTDQGTTWELVRSDPSHGSYWQFAFDSNGHVYQAAGNYADSGLVWKSTDNGQSWTRLPFANGGGQVLNIAVGPSDRIYAYTSNNGVFVSTNGGSTWTAKNTGLPAPNQDTYHYALAVMPDGSVFVATAPGLYRSTDGGDSWQQVSTQYIQVVFRNPATGYLYFGAHTSLYRSTDNGTTWTFQNNSIGTLGDSFGRDGRTSVVVLPSGRMIYGVEGSVAYSSNSGTSWTESTAGIGAGYVKSMWQKVNGIIVASTVGGGLHKLGDGSSTWQKTLDGPAQYVERVVENPANGNWWSSTVCDGLFRSTDDGTSWVQTNGNLSNNCVGPLIFHPSSGHLFAGTDAGLFRSTDESAWSLLSTPFTRLDELQVNSVTGELLAVSNGVMYRGSSNGQTWVNIKPEFTHVNVAAVALDSSLIAAGYGAINRSTNNGATWTTSYGDGSFAPFALYRDTEGILWCGHRAGAMRSLDNGKTWSAVDLTGITNTNVRSFAKRITDSKLFIGTYGHGVFRHTRSFAMSQPGFTAPASGATGVSRTPALTWTSSTNADQYQIQIYSGVPLTDAYLVVDTIVSGTSLNVLSQLSAGTQHFIRVRGVNPTGASNWSNLNNFQTIFVQPAFTEGPAHNSSATEGQSFTVSIGGINNQPTTVTLTYGNLGTTSGSDITMSNSSGTYSASIPANGVTARGLWFRIRASNNGGTAYTPSQTGFTSIPVQVGTSGIASTKTIGAYPSGIAQNAYFTIGNPFNTNVDLTLTFGPVSSSSWKAWYYDGISFVETTVMDNTGRGYIVYNRTGGNRDFILNAATTNVSNKGTDLVLVPGWNVISWPHSYTANVTARNNTLIGSLWSYNGNSGWVVTTQLKPFGAYAVFNKGSGNITFGSAVTLSGVSKNGSDIPIPDWSISLGISAGKFEDVGVHMGVVSDEVLIQEFNEAKPMFMGEYVRMSLGTGLASEFKLNTADIQSWDVTVENRTDVKSVSIRTSIERVPNDYRVIAYDPALNNVMDLGSDQSMELVAGEMRKLVVLAGSTAEVNHELERLSKSVPQNFVLTGNYPNPFNPETTVRYGLARTSNVSIKIYNTFGQEVATLVNGTIPAGYHQVVWGGKDARGRAMSSGIYFVRMKADGFVSTKKMMLVK